MFECLECGEDISDLVSFGTINDVVFCPKCNHKMKVYYEESYDGESGEECISFWLEETS